MLLASGNLEVVCDALAWPWNHSRRPQTPRSCFAGLLLVLRCHATSPPHSTCCPGCVRRGRSGHLHHSQIPSSAEGGRPPRCWTDHVREDSDSLGILHNWARLAQAGGV